MSLLGAALAAGVGLISDKKKNKRSKEQMALERESFEQQKKISNWIQGLSEQLMARGSNQVDPYGGTTGYDAASGTYKSTLGPRQQQLQDLSDNEEAARLTLDQQIRRAGLGDFERIRTGAAGESDVARTDLSNFRRGIGAVDPAALAARMRLDRQGAVNAGFDDAERAASTLQVRTGSSAVGDALKRLAVDRVRAQAQIGDPEVEALQLAEGINRGRESSILDRYNMMSDRGGAFYDAAYKPAPYAGIADAKTSDQMKFDLSKFDIAQGGSGAAAAGLGNAAAGLRQGYNITEANRIHAPLSKTISGFDKLLDEYAKRAASGGGFG